MRFKITEKNQIMANRFEFFAVRCDAIISRFYSEHELTYVRNLALGRTALALHMYGHSRCM